MELKHIIGKIDPVLKIRIDNIQIPTSEHSQGLKTISYAPVSAIPLKNTPRLRPLILAESLPY